MTSVTQEQAFSERFCWEVVGAVVVGLAWFVEELAAVSIAGSKLL